MSVGLSRLRSNSASAVRVRYLWDDPPGYLINRDLNNEWISLKRAYPWLPEIQSMIKSPIQMASLGLDKPTCLSLEISDPSGPSILFTRAGSNQRPRHRWFSWISGYPQNWMVWYSQRPAFCRLSEPYSVVDSPKPWVPRCGSNGVPRDPSRVDLPLFDVQFVNSNQVSTQLVCLSLWHLSFQLFPWYNKVTILLENTCPLQVIITTTSMRVANNECCDT
jgi:hypothetical protein